MFTITTTVTSNASGATVILAKGHGKQRTTKSNPAMSDEWNRGGAAGALLAVLLDDRQKATLRHPSGGQRVNIKSMSDAGGKHKWTIDV